MDWFEQVDGYCERLGPGVWDEPLNAVTNLAFMVAAIWVWPRARGNGRVLSVILFVIGLGSGLFHTLATVWAGVADVLPIVLFILTYIYAVHRDVLGWRPVGSGLASLMFLPFAAGVAQVAGLLPFFAVSGVYWAVPVALLAYGAVLGGAVRAGFWRGAAILALSITLRSLDDPLCQVVPIGTHFLWHLLNAAMLAYMIVVHSRLKDDAPLAASGLGR